MTTDLESALLFVVFLVLVAGLLVWLSERADSHDRHDTQTAETSERARWNMPDGHPERLTRMLSPVVEFQFQAIVAELAKSTVAEVAE